MVAKQKRPAPAEDPPQPAKKHKIDFCDQITVEFAGQVFFIPSILLRSRSSFAARETRHGLLRIPNKASLTPDTFSTYLQLLYTGEVVLNEPQEFMTAGNTLKKLIDLYCFCEALQDPTSMNLTISKLVSMPIEEMHHVIKRILVRHVYDVSEAGSMLREFTLDCAASRWTIKVLAWFPQDFKDELLLRLQAMRDHSGRAEAIRSKIDFPERYFVPA